MKSFYWLIAVLALNALPMSAGVKITPGQEEIAVEIDGRPFTTLYLAQGGNKPYLYPLRTATGALVTRPLPQENVPGETKDHPHHRGMFFSFGDVNGYNFWATEPNSKVPGKSSMVLRKVVKAKGGAKSGAIVAVFDGLNPQGKPVMTETRTYVFHASAQLRVVDFEIVIDPLETLKFADTKEGTFGIRLATSISEAKGGKMVNAEGAETEKNVWGKRSPWVDYTGQVAGQTVGVAIMDHPSNPRYPTYWHSRAYGLFAANVVGVRDFENDKTKDGSLTISPGQKLRFRYRVVIHPGDTRSADIAGLYQKYTAGK